MSEKRQQKRAKTTIDAFFRRESKVASASNLDISTPVEQHSSKAPRIKPKEVEFSSLECDPGKRPQIWEYDVNQRDEIRCAYIKARPYQFCLSEYPYLGQGKHHRRFNLVGSHYFLLG